MVARLRTELFFVVAGIILLGVLFLSQHSALNRPGGTNYVTTVGVPFDDVYIHCRYAANLLAGDGYSFNPPTQLTADTSPLWVVLIAAGGLLTSHLDVVAVLLSALAWLMLAPGVYRVAKHVLGLGEVASIIAGVMMLLNGRALALSASGMETSLAILLALVSVEAHIRSRDLMRPRLREALFLGLGVITRPELLFLAFLCGSDWLLLLMRKQISVPSFAKYASVLSLFVIAYFALPLAIEDRLSYHSSIVQGFGLHAEADGYYILRSVAILAEQYFYLLVPLMLMLVYDLFIVAVLSATTRTWTLRLGIPRISARTAVPILFVIGLPLLQSFVAPQYRHFGRYIFPLMPFVVLAVAAFIDNHQGEDGRRFDANLFSRIAPVVLLVVFVAPFTLRWINGYGKAVSNINDQHLAVSDWIAVHCNKSDVIAADDVGAIAFFTNRNIIDLTGLVSPAIYPLQHDQQLVWQAARARGANVFVIYTRLNPSFFAYAKDSLELQNAFTVRAPLVSSADTTMSVYRVKGDAHATR